MCRRRPCASASRARRSRPVRGRRDRQPREVAVVRGRSARARSVRTSSLSGQPSASRNASLTPARLSSTPLSTIVPSRSTTTMRLGIACINVAVISRSRCSCSFALLALGDVDAAGDDAHHAAPLVGHRRAAPGDHALLAARVGERVLVSAAGKSGAAARSAACTVAPFGSSMKTSQKSGRGAASSSSRPLAIERRLVLVDDPPVGVDDDEQARRGVDDVSRKHELRRGARPGAARSRAEPAPAATELDELRLVVERRVVDERRDRRSVSLDRRHRTSPGCRPARRPRRPSASTQPSPSRAGRRSRARVVQRLRERVPERDARVEREEHPRRRRLVEAAAQDAGEERERHAANETRNTTQIDRVRDGSTPDRRHGDEQQRHRQRRRRRRPGAVSCGSVARRLPPAPDEDDATMSASTPTMIIDADDARPRSPRPGWFVDRDRALRAVVASASRGCLSTRATSEFAPIAVAPPTPTSQQSRRLERPVRDRRGSAPRRRRTRGSRRRSRPSRPTVSFDSRGRRRTRGSRSRRARNRSRSRAVARARRGLRRRTTARR